jgi:hypothetical protein
LIVFPLVQGGCRSALEAGANEAAPPPLHFLRMNWKW